MALLLAGLSSMIFGVADFVGGMATRRAPAISVVVTSQIVGGLGILFAGLLFTPSWPGVTDLAWGAGAGLTGGLGLVMLYHSLATVRIGVTAPIGALVGTTLPVMFGVVIGERPATTAWIGIVVGIVAVVLISRAPDEPAAAVPGGMIAAAWGVAVGTAFGLFGILISRTSAESGLWPLVGARGASLIMLVVAALVLGRPVLAEGAVRPAAAAGALDMVANVLFLFALRRGLLSLVAVIMAMYPATTIGLARVVLAERIGRVQAVGLALGVAAIWMIVVA